MDNLTHTLFGLTVARTPMGRAGRGTTLTLLLASNAPDIDIVTALGGVASYLHWHRGPTHGPLGIVGLAFACALIARAFAQWRPGTTTSPAASLLSLWMVGCVGALCHVLMDLPTSYGTRLLSPFSWTWFAEDWMPIIDVYLLAILAAGLLIRPHRGMSGVGDTRLRQAYIALALTLGNYGIRAYSHHSALSQAPSVFGGQLSPRCPDAVPPGRWIDSWPRPTVTSPRNAATRQCMVEIAAIPDFLSPFRWQLIAQYSNAYERRAVDLLDARSRAGADVTRLSVWHPNQWTPAVERAAASDIGRVFLGFARFPAARSMIDPQGAATVRWTDVRFAMIGPGTTERETGMFLAIVRVAADGSIVEQHLGQ